MGTSTRRRRRTFGSAVVQMLVTRVAVFGVGAAVLALGHLLAPISSSAAVPADDTARPLPSWTAADAAANPGCVPFSSWPAGAPAEFLVVHSFRDNVHRKVAFAAAWADNHDDTEVDDVWVVGVCGARP
jgi:hypothetical protein